MTLHTVLTAAHAVVHPLSTAAQLATTVSAGAVGLLLLRARQRLHTPRTATPGAPLPRDLAPVPARSASPVTRPAHRRGTPPSSGLTCRPQLETPPGTERARGEVERWRTRGELDPETYRDLQRVFAEVESATRR